MCARLSPKRRKHEEPSVVLLQINLEAEEEHPILAHGDVVEDQRREEYCGLRFLTDLHQHIGAHRVHGLEELVDKADLVGVFDTVAALVVEIVDRRVNHGGEGYSHDMVEETLHD